MQHLSPRPAGSGRPGGDRRRSEPARLEGRGLEAFCLHYAGRVDEREDDLLGQRSPGRTKACEAGVNRRQIVQIDACVALLRRCQRER